MLGDFSLEELEFIELLQPGGIPDDLPEAALESGPRPTSRVIARIKDMTMKKVSTIKPYPRKSDEPVLPASNKFRWTWAAAAVLVMALIITAALGPRQVVAGIRGMLKYIPGIGLREAGQVTLVMEKRIKIRHGEMELEVRGLMSDSKSTVIHLRAAGKTYREETFINVKDGDLPYLEDESGRRYRHTSRSISSGSDTATAWISFEPLASSVRQVVLNLPDHAGSAGTWRVEIPLVAGEALTAAEDFGPTVDLRGIAVTARAEAQPGETIVPLLVRVSQAGAVVEEVGRYTSTQAAQTPTLRDDEGKEYPYLPDNSKISGTPYELRELYFPPVNPEAGPVRLSIPLVRIREQGRVKVTLPVPENGPVELDRTIQLGRFSLKLVRAEQIGGQVRIYVDPGPNSNEALESFSLEFKESGSWMYEADEQTGRMVYFQVGVQPGQKKLNLTLKDPVVTVTGPWELDLPLGQ